MTTVRLAPLLTVTALALVVSATLAAPPAAATPPVADSTATGAATSDATATDPATAAATESATGDPAAAANPATTESTAAAAADSATTDSATTGSATTDSAATNSAAATAEPADNGSPFRLRGDLGAHDPALVKGGNGQDWYVFATGDPTKGGGSITIRSSKDGRKWTYAGTMWDKLPDWITVAVPGANNLWAPEVYKHDGVYYLYYAASTWGKNNSVIGLATNTTLDPQDPAYLWADQGQVIRSAPESNFNSIDPGIVEDADGTPWMAFGSYWTGIQMVQLEWPSGKRSADRTRLHIADRKAAPNAIEAPYILPHDGWYYMFTSWGQCCQGVQSDYKIMVGRSRSVTGPYVDRDGRALLDGGGTTLADTEGDRFGPGGQSVSEEIMAYHYYDATADGAPKLALQRVSWGEDGWPRLGADRS
jgi:arabinan endo-1,5-alpha-L-arabinosidase